MADREPPMPQRIPRQYQRGTDPYAVYREMADRQQALPPAQGRHESSDVDSPAGAPGFDGAPPHYKASTGIQVFDVWDTYVGDWRIYAAQCFKYIARLDKKGSAVNDALKAAHDALEAFNRAPREEGSYLSVEDITPELQPDAVASGFGLQGLLYDAAVDLLTAFTVPNPRTYLRAALSELQEYSRGM